MATLEEIALSLRCTAGKITKTLEENGITAPVCESSEDAIKSLLRFSSQEIADQNFFEQVKQAIRTGESTNSALITFREELRRACAGSEKSNPQNAKYYHAARTLASDLRDCSRLLERAIQSKTLSGGLEMYLCAVEMHIRIEH
jgi:hypothetical protein